VPHVTTTQTYVLPDSFNPDQELISATNLASDGFEGGIPTRRVLLGGTGKCKGAQGEVIQQTLGMSTGGLFNHRFTLKFTKWPATCRLRD